MSFSPVLIAIPIFAALIAIEAWYASRRDPSAYQAKDAWNNILIGFVSVCFGGLFGTSRTGLCRGLRVRSLPITADACGDG